MAQLLEQLAVAAGDCCAYCISTIYSLQITYAMHLLVSGVSGLGSLSAVREVQFTVLALMLLT